MYNEQLAGKLTKNLKYDERLRRIPMMTRKNNIVMRGPNDNINHKNVVII